MVRLVISDVLILQGSFYRRGTFQAHAAIIAGGMKKLYIERVTTTEVVQEAHRIMELEKARK